MTADYHCPECHGQLANAGAANAWQCERCREIVVEAVDGTARRVRSFYRRVSPSRWGGLHGR